MLFKVWNPPKAFTDAEKSHSHSGTLYLQLPFIQGRCISYNNLNVTIGTQCTCTLWVWMWEHFVHNLHLLECDIAKMFVCCLTINALITLWFCRIMSFICNVMMSQACQYGHFPKNTLDLRPGVSRCRVYKVSCRDKRENNDTGGSRMFLGVGRHPHQRAWNEMQREINLEKT